MGDRAKVAVWLRYSRRHKESNVFREDWMHLLHVVESLARGGLERVVCDLVMEQARQGYKVEVFCIFSPGAFAAELQDAGIRVVSANKRSGPDLSVLMALRDASRSARHQVVHTHNPVANYYTCAAELTSWRRLPIVNTRHNMGASDPNDRREKLFRLSVARTAKVAMVSPQVSQRFIDQGIVPAAKAAVVMNGIPLQRYVRSNASTRASARAALSLQEDAFVIGSVGRLVRVKNHSLLLAAAAPMCLMHPRVKIVLIGHGDLREALQQQAQALGIASSVHLIGERPDIPQLLPAFDVFAMPSRSEGHSISLLEASAAGLPLVATAVGGNPEIVQQELTGLLVPSEDSAAFEAALSRMFLDEPGRLAFASQARLWAERTISVDAMTAKYEQLYLEALRP
jgi:glycosyltransferase involved in cell wall biosynthesis